MPSNSRSRARKPVGPLKPVVNNDPPPEAEGEQTSYPSLRSALWLYLVVLLGSFSILVLLPATTVDPIFLRLIMALLVAGGMQSDFHVPYWVILASSAAIGLGTMSGGWRVVKTMGTKLTRLQPMGGVCAELSAAITLFFASAKGIPVSTTHTITGAIVGVGSTQRASSVRWGVAGNIVWAWIFTIPASAFVAAMFYGFSTLMF
mgnify:CR=1 FL=1